MLIWISPGTIGTAINPIASANKHARQVTEMTKDDKQSMDAHDIACESKSVYYYKGFQYERLTDAIRYAENEANRLNDDGS